jgi:hypothetical protein
MQNECGMNPKSLLALASKIIVGSSPTRLTIIFHRLTALETFGARSCNAQSESELIYYSRSVD